MIWTASASQNGNLLLKKSDFQSECPVSQG
jgi:hypothetical protein